MNKKSLFIIPLCVLLSGCKFNLFGKTIKIFEKDTPSEKEEEKEQIIPEDITPEEQTQHATSISMDPKAPFYLKVGESRDIKVTLSPSPTKENEKEFTWKLQGNFISYEVKENETNKVTVTGLEPGISYLTATNSYNEDLTKTFTIKVIDFDDETDYLWQYDSTSDKNQFGYTSENKNGNESGVANLNGIEWSFERSNVTSLNTSQSGYLGFGKGSEPETHIHFETENARTVNFISIEATSANSLATMTIKVGEAVYLDNVVVPKLSEEIEPLSSGEIVASSGKITIDIYTPEYDKNRAEDPTYKKPGGFFIKSILIDFNEALPDKTMTLVDDEEDIVNDGKYLIIGYSNIGYAALDGSLGSGVKDNPLLLEEFSLENNVAVKADFDKYSFVATFDENNKLNFTSSGGIKIGLSAGGSLSTTKSPALLGWDYELDSSNHLVMSMMDQEDTPKRKYFGANDTTGKFSAYASAKYNIYLYKF